MPNNTIPNHLNKQAVFSLFLIWLSVFIKALASELLAC